MRRERLKQLGEDIGGGRNTPHLLVFAVYSTSDKHKDEEACNALASV